MEAVLDFSRGRQKLVIILRGREGGGAEIDAGPAPLITFMGGGGGVRGGGGGQGGEREQLCPCTKCSYMHVGYTLSLFLISPSCCCSLSRYKKVPQERYIRKILRFCNTFFDPLWGRYDCSPYSLFQSRPKIFLFLNSYCAGIWFYMV